MEVLGDSSCPSCAEQGRDKTGNHLVHYRNTEDESEFASCNRCGYHETITEANKSEFESVRHTSRVLTEEEVAEVLNECSELPIKKLESRGIKEITAERFGVRVGVSSVDGTTPISHFYPKTVEGVLLGYKVRVLDPKAFYSVGNGRNSDFFGINQARLGDVWSGKLFIFEDELSAMSGFQILVDYSKSSYRPAVVALPDGAGSAAAVLQRNQAFVSTFDDIVICMDNDEAGENAVRTIRSLFPKVKVARIPKGERADGKPIKDANDMLMEERGLEVFNALRYSAAQETPDSAVSVAECMEDALKKPEWGLEFPWKGLTDMTYGLNYGELIAIGGGVGSGKSLLAHEMAAWYCEKHDINCGAFLLEEGVGSSLRNIAGKSANVPFHLPDLDYDPEDLKTAAMKFEGKLWLYNNFGQNDWEAIKQCIRFWVIQNKCKIIFLD